MVSMVLVVIIVLIVQVMPVFEEVFKNLGLNMTGFARTMLDAGELLSEYSLVIVASGLAIATFAIVFSGTKPGKKASNFLYEHFFLTKKLAQAQAANKFAFSMSLMLASGIKTRTAFNFAEELNSSGIARDKIVKTRDLLENGMSFQTALVEGGLFSKDHNGVIVAGVRTGDAPEMLMHIAQSYEQEAKESLQKLLSILEPTLVAILCITVGIVMLSVMLPLTGIMASF